ncbi:MAG: alpha/beta fold hydrolase [Pseudomonadota bacterium]
MKAHDGLLALALLIVPVSAVAAPAVPQGPAGDAFYVPPSPLPAADAGTPLQVRKLMGTLALPSAERNLLVMYRSQDPKGQPVAVSGTISIPKGRAPEGGWPLVTFTHGTVGLAAMCGPSLDTPNGPEHPYVKAYAAFLDGLVAQGIAVVATDYQGLGVAGFHPFFQGVPNAKNALDMVRAARAIEPEIGAKYAVIGHSQGGQADLFAAATGAAYAPELDLVGNIAFAPGSHVAARLAAVRASDKVELALPYVLYVLTSYSTTDPSIDLAQILTPKAISHLPDLKNGCMTKALTEGYWSTAIAKDQFLAQPVLDSFLAMAQQNEPGGLSIPVPTLMIQGTADVTVRPQDTDALARDLCKKANSVTYRALAGSDHDGVLESGAVEARAFLKARFAGQPIASNCADLPFAAKP